MRSLCSEVQSLRYSRACHICVNVNPRRRVTLAACGHVLCASCAGKLDTIQVHSLSFHLSFQLFSK